MAQKSPVMQSLKAVGAVISVRSLSSGPEAVASLAHHSWDREPLLRLRLCQVMSLAPNSDQKIKHQRKRRQREHSFSCPTFWSVQPNSIWELLELDVVSLWTSVQQHLTPHSPWTHSKFKYPQHLTVKCSQLSCLLCKGLHSLLCFKSIF